MTFVLSSSCKSVMEFASFGLCRSFDQYWLLFEAAPGDGSGAGEVTDADFEELD